MGLKDRASTRRVGLPGNAKFTEHATIRLLCPFLYGVKLKPIQIAVLNQQGGFLSEARGEKKSGSEYFVSAVVNLSILALKKNTYQVFRFQRILRRDESVSSQPNVRR